MPEPPFFRRVRIEAFRGFRDAAEVDVDASAVIITGPNGTGKTSFFDAIQWLLLGDLTRLASLPHRPRDEYVVNQYRLPGPAVVEADLTLMNPEGRSVDVRLRRSGRGKDTLLQWNEDTLELIGASAEDRLQLMLTPDKSVPLATALLTSALLQQDVMREVLEASESARFQHLNALLGLDALGEFEQAAGQLVKERGSASVQATSTMRETEADLELAQSKLAAVHLRQQQLPVTDTARGELESAAAEVASLVEVAAEGMESQTVLQQTSQELALAQDTVRALSSTWESIDRELASVQPVSSESLESAQKEVVDARQLEAEARNILAEVAEAEEIARRDADHFAQLAALAVPLLTEVCPVCRQSIDPADVELHLRDTSEVGGRLAAAASAREEAEARLRQATAHLLRVRQTLEGLEEASARWQRLRSRRAEALESQTTLASGLQYVRVVALREPSERPGLELLEVILGALKSLRTAVDALSLALGAGEEAVQERQLTAQVDALRRRVHEQNERASQLELLHKRAQLLLSASLEASVPIVERRFTALRPLIHDVYVRLDPHPSFKSMDLHHDFYRSRGATRPVVRDVEEDLEADPMLVFSSSQANIVALSYFLALGWASRERTLPFLLMDDPLQSMDDVNVLGFADLCRFARRQRQLVISTHERRFAALLERKLASRRPGEKTKLLNFAAWDRRGPQIEAQDVPAQLDVSEPRLLGSTQAG